MILGNFSFPLPPNTLLICMGPPRSGLSVLSACLRIMGFTPYEHQPDATTINQLLLQDLGLSPYYTFSLPQDWLQSPAAAKAKDRIQKLLSDKQLSVNSYQLSGKSVPPQFTGDTSLQSTNAQTTDSTYFQLTINNSLLTPLWHTAFMEASITSHYILIVRHPHEVALSLQANNNIDLHQAHILWFSHIRTAMSALKDQNYSLITFDQLLADPVSTVGTCLSSSTSSHLTFYSSLLNCVQPSLKNHHAYDLPAPDKETFKPFAQIYNQIRAGQMIADIAPAIIDTLLQALNQRETKHTYFSNNKAKLSGSDTTLLTPSFTLYLEIILPSFKQELGITHTYHLLEGMWQKIELPVAEPKQLTQERIIIRLFKGKGSASISSIKLMNQATEEVVWQAVSIDELQKIKTSDSLIRVSSEQKLDLIVTDDNAELYLPILSSLPDSPLLLDLWIKASHYQLPLMKIWRDEVVATSNNEFKLSSKMQLFKSKFDHFFHVYYQKNKNCYLTYLCDLYGTDKGSFRNSDHPYRWPPHSYSDFYSMIFDDNRLNVRYFFECGIGTNNPDIEANMTIHGRPAASLRVWRDYFPNAHIIGADIDKDILFSEERISTYYIDQTDSKSVDAFWKAVGVKNVDIILDDGLHTFEAGVTLFENSIGHLAPHGLYIIEDIKDKYLFDYLNYFNDSDKYQVYFINLFRPYAELGDNNLILIQKKLSMTSSGLTKKEGN